MRNAPDVTLRAARAEFERLFSIVDAAVKRGNFGSPAAVEEPATRSSRAAKSARASPRSPAGTTLLQTVDRLSDLLASHRDSLFRASHEAFKCKSLISDVYDYFGRRREARAILAGAEAVYDELRRTLRKVTLKDNDRLEWREKIRFVVYWAQAIYREHDYTRAETILDTCFESLRYLRRDGETDEDAFPSWGTLGQIHYFRGRVYRHLNNLAGARDEFAESIRCYFKRAEHKTRTAQDARDAALRGCAASARPEIEHQYELAVQEALELTHYKVAKSLALGLGWINSTIGRYRTALQENLLPAKVLLTATGDVLNKARIELLEGANIRVLAGHDHDELRRAITVIQAANDAFRGHPYYRAKADYELALAFLYLKNFPAAASAQQRVAALGKREDDSRWLCEALILESRINLASGQRETALDRAADAVNESQARRQPVCLIDALIAKGRANIALANLHDARSDLLKAIRLNDEGSGNPKTAAACYLRLADSYVVERDLQRAQEWLDRWTLIEKEVEHRSLRDLAVEVRDKLEKSRGFVIPHDEKDLHYHRHAFQLQRFLWSKARDRHQTQEATAAALQVTRVTLQDWTKTFEKADDFEKELNTLSERLKRVASPNAERLQRMIKSIGGVETARTILSEMPAWYDAMLSSAIPDLLVENVMLNEHWKGLFTQRELNKAKSRLPKPEAF